MNNFADLFINLYNVSFGKIDLDQEQKNRLNDLLTSFIYQNVGYQINEEYDKFFIMFYFMTFFHHIDSTHTVVSDIEKYINEFNDKLITHPNVKLFIEVIEWIYSEKYNGKLGDMPAGINSNIIIDIMNNKVNITSLEENSLLPNIVINNIDVFEEVLSEYIKTIENSETLYNIFNNVDFDEYHINDKKKMLIEGTILNATPKDLYNLEEFFLKYINYVNDEVLKRLLDLKKVGNTFDDELYFKVKKSDFEYETPYSLSFMLKDSMYEFPNVRVGVDSSNGINKATIITTQTSQLTGEKDNISKMIKENSPKVSKYRYYKPNHFMSLLMSFGLFQGIGINQISVQTFMPLRYHKTIRDKNMNKDEADAYLSRMIKKNKNTYYRILDLAKNIKMEENNNELLFTFEDKKIITWNNEYLNNIYKLLYEHGELLNNKEY